MGDALLPVEIMIEDKAGWGLTPGLRWLQHRQTLDAARWATPTTARLGCAGAGLGWAGLGVPNSPPISSARRSCFLTKPREPSKVKDTFLVLFLFFHVAP